MSRTSIFTISATLLGIAGCAAPSGGSYRSYSSGGATTTAEYTPGGAQSVSRAPASAHRSSYHRTGTVVPPPAPGAPGQSYRYRERRRIVKRQPQDRPGLGTVFGSRIRSRVSFTSFRRARTRPDGVVSIHYNDYQGLQAMTRRLRRSCCSRIGAYRVGAGITVQLVDSAMRPLTGVQIGGRTIVLGKAGYRYGILVRNKTARRYEIVASVDGLDVIDGKRASTTKRGYILPGYGRVYIRGFRTSRYNVAAFKFGSVRNSYAARTGSARNVGVVGVAAFSEYRPPVYNDDEVRRRLRAQPFDSGYARPPR